MNQFTSPKWGELIWDPFKNTKVASMPIAFPVASGDLCPGAEDKGNGTYLLHAGALIAEGGAIADSENAPIGILAADLYFYAQNPAANNIAPVIVSGYVDQAAAEASSGITYDSDEIAALATAGVYLQADSAIVTKESLPGDTLVVYAETYTSVDDNVVALTEPTIISAEEVEACLAEGRIPVIIATKEGSETLVLYYSGIDYDYDVYVFVLLLGGVAALIPLDDAEEVEPIEEGGDPDPQPPIGEAI